MRIGLLVLIALACAACDPEGLGRPNPNFLVIGHRGAPRVAAENTLPSFEVALVLGANAIETDLCLTQDGVFVLWHDRDPDDGVALVRQSGADSVVTSSDAVGRLLGLSSLSPTLGNVMEDLLTYGEGLEVAERDLLVNEVGKQPQALPDQVIAVVRDGVVHRYFDPSVTQLVRGDRLVVVRPAEELPWAPRPGTHGETLSGEEE